MADADPTHEEWVAWLEATGQQVCDTTFVPGYLLASGYHHALFARGGRACGHCGAST
jgi:hypothetical protein